MTEALLLRHGSRWTALCSPKLRSRGFRPSLCGTAHVSACKFFRSRGGSMGRHTGQHKSCGSPFAPGVSLSKAHPLTNLRAQAPSTVPWAARHLYSALWLLFRLRRGRPNPEVASSGSAAVQQRPRIVDHFVGRKRPPREALELPCFPSCQ